MMLTSSSALLPLLLLLAGHACQAFIIPSSTGSFRAATTAAAATTTTTRQHRILSTATSTIQSKSSSTALQNGIILDVDDNFFTYTFFSIGLFYSLGKAYNRYLLEEIAFEQRKYESRERILDEDPTMDELTLRRMESAKWLSVYGRKFRGRGGGDGDTMTSSSNSSDGGEGEVNRRRRRSNYRRSVATMDSDDDYTSDEYDDGGGAPMMSSSEISAFESQYNIPYDPYYDEPYLESQLPTGKYKVDKSYGDRRYENGEIFYKEEGTGYYYRMGSRPRQKKFWDWGKK
jgi:hypothetical protein